MNPGTKVRHTYPACSDWEGVVVPYEDGRTVDVAETDPYYDSKGNLSTYRMYVYVDFRSGTHPDGRAITPGKGWFPIEALAVA